MDSNLQLVVQASLDMKLSEDTIRKQLQEISKRIGAIKFNIQYDPDSLKQYTATMVNDFSQASEKVKNVTKKALQDAMKGANYKEALSELNQVLQSVEQEGNNITKILLTQNARTNEITRATYQYSNAMGEVVTQALKLQRTFDSQTGKLSKVNLVPLSTISSNNVDVQRVANYQEASKELRAIQQLMTQIAKLSSDDGALAKELNVQLDSHKQKYSDIFSRKIQISEQESVDAINQTQLNKLLEQEVALEEKIRVIKAAQVDTSNRTSSTITPRQPLGQKIDIGTPVDYNADTKTLQSYVQAATGARAQLLGVSTVVDSLGNNMRVMNARVDDGSGFWQKYKFTLDQTTQSLYKMDAGQASMSLHNKTFIDQFKTMYERIIMFGVGLGAYNASLSFFTKGVEYVNELNKSLTDISIVTYQSQAQVSKLADEYAKLGDKMKTPLGDIAGTAADIFRQGITNNDQVIQRMKDIITYAKISSLSIADSNKILTATINSMGVSGQKASDVFSKLGDATATGKLCA